jgi:uncharacterized DUF497 family protein
VFVWDEAKQKSNLKKHGLDFKDADLVYDNPDKSHTTPAGKANAV